MTDQVRPATRPSPDLTILETRVYRGANVWSYDRAIHLVVDLGSLEDFPTNTLPGFTENLPEAIRACDAARRPESTDEPRRGMFPE